MIPILKIYLKKFWSWSKLHKKKWVIFCLLCASFFIIQFPYEESIKYLTSKIREQTKSSFQLSYDSFYFNPFSLSLVFKNPKIQLHPGEQHLTLKQINISPSLRSLFTFKPGGTVILIWKDSKIALTFQKKNIEKKQTGWLITLNTYQWDPSSLSPVWPILSNISGKFNFSGELQLDPTFKIKPKGMWQLNGYNIQSKDFSYTFPGTIGTVNLPDFQWSRVSSSGKIKKDEVLISDLIAGEKKEPFQVQTRGSLLVMFKKITGSTFPRFYIKSYDIGLDILADDNLRQQLYFLDLLFQSVASQTPDGNWRYLARIKGNPANFFDLSPVSSLPSLQEMQNPENVESL